MKYVNFYSGTAMVLIASLLGSLASATGQMAPPLIVGALLITVLVLGWAGGASDARHEVDRLTRLESGRQLLTQSHIKQRDKLEAALARLQHRIEEVTASNAGLRKVAERWADEVGNLRAQARDSQAAIELFTAAQAKNMIRITALEGENAELRKRPSAEVMIETAVRLMRENSFDEDSDEEYLSGRATGIAHMHTELVQHMMAQAPSDSLTGSASTSAAGAQS